MDGGDLGRGLDLLKGGVRVGVAEVVLDRVVEEDAELKEKFFF